MLMKIQFFFCSTYDTLQLFFEKTFQHFESKKKKKPLKILHCDLVKPVFLSKIYTT